LSWLTPEKRRRARRRTLVVWSLIWFLTLGLSVIGLFFSHPKPPVWLVYPLIILAAVSPWFVFFKLMSMLLPELKEKA